MSNSISLKAKDWLVAGLVLGFFFVIIPLSAYVYSNIKSAQQEKLIKAATEQLFKTDDFTAAQAQLTEALFTEKTSIRLNAKESVELSPAELASFSHTARTDFKGYFNSKFFPKTAIAARNMCKTLTEGIKEFDTKNAYCELDLYGQNYMATLSSEGSIYGKALTALHSIVTEDLFNLINADTTELPLDISYNRRTRSLKAQALLAKNPELILDFSFKIND